MADQNHEEAFENSESNFFSFESVLPTDPDRNVFNHKLHQIDSLYFSIKNFITMFK